MKQNFFKLILRTISASTFILMFTILTSLISTSSMAMVSSTAPIEKSYKFKFQDRISHQVVYETTEQSTSEDSAYKKAASKCMSHLSEYSTDDALDICANPRS